MRKFNTLPSKNLSKEHREFLEHWRVSKRAMLLEGDETNHPVYIWTGKFIEGETVTFATRAGSPFNSKVGIMFVGITKEVTVEDVVECDGSPLEVFADAATNRAKGLSGAINLLRLMTDYDLQDIYE